MIPPPYLLVHTDPIAGRYYFVALGDNWGRGDDRRLIAETTQDRIKARVFDTLPEALEVLVIAGDPPCWSAEPIT
jgi:hypothetical protein